MIEFIIILIGFIVLITGLMSKLILKIFPNLNKSKIKVLTFIAITYFTIHAIVILLSNFWEYFKSFGNGMK